MFQVLHRCCWLGHLCSIQMQYHRLAVRVVVEPTHVLFAPAITAVSDGLVAITFWVVPIQPLASDTVTVYVPGPTSILLERSPVLHSNAVPPLAVRVVVEPTHVLFAPAMTAVNDGLVAITFWVVPVQPLASDTVTVYVPGPTSMLLERSPVLHSYAVPPIAVRVVVEPTHVLFAPAITAVSDGLVAITFWVVPVQPLHRIPSRCMFQVLHLYYWKGHLYSIQMLYHRLL